MSARYLTDLKTRKSKIIHVYRNGDRYSRAALILLKPLEQKEIERVIRAVEEKVTLPNNKPIKRIFTIEGDEIEKSSQIEDQSYYVVGSTENFMKANYGTTRYWTILGPVKWNKCNNVIYEPPETKEIQKSRLTSDQWKLRINNKSKSSTKMTKSMSAFTSDRTSFRKNKKMTLSAGQAERVLSDPPNGRDKGMVPDDDFSLEKNDSLELGNNLSDSTHIENNQQIENFLNDSVKMSSEFDKNNDMALYLTDETIDTKYHYDIVSDITNLTSNNEKSAENNSLSNSCDVESDNNIISGSNSTEGRKEESGSIYKSSKDIMELKPLEETANDDRNDKWEKETNETFSYSSECIEENNKMISYSEENKDDIQKYNIKDNIIGEKIEENELMIEKRNEELTDDEVSILKEEEMNSEKSIHLEKEKVIIKDDTVSVYKEKEEDDENSDDSFYEKEKAALLIQANFRGNFKKKLLMNKVENNEIVESTKEEVFKNNDIEKDLKDLNYSNKINAIKDFSDEENQNTKYREKEATIIQEECQDHTKRNDTKHISDLERSSKEEYINNEQCGKDTDGRDLASKEEAAKVIQSNFRGYLVREELKLLSENVSQSEDQSEHCEEENDEGTSDIDTNEKAATIIQSNFRGHLVRKQIKHPSKNAVVNSQLEKCGEENNDSEEIKYSSEAEMHSEDLDTYSEQSNEGMKNGIDLRPKTSLLLKDMEEEDESYLHKNANYSERISNISDDESNMDIKNKEKEKKESISETNDSEYMKEHLGSDNEYKIDVEIEKFKTIEGYIFEEESKDSDKCESSLEDRHSNQYIFQKEDVEDDNPPQENLLKLHDNRDKISDSYNLHEDLPVTDKENCDEINMAKENAAIIIQSHFRGHLTRFGLKSTSEIIDNNEIDEEQDRSYAAEDSEEDDENIVYSPIKNNKFDVGIYDQNQFSNKSSDDSFVFSKKDQDS